jgi:hypothetical protein
VSDPYPSELSELLRVIAAEAFANLNPNSPFGFRATDWRIDATTGQITGNGDAITSPARMSLDPVLSADGTKVVYLVPHGETSGEAFLTCETNYG